MALRFHFITIHKAMCTPRLPASFGANREGPRVPLLLPWLGTFFSQDRWGKVSSDLSGCVETFSQSMPHDIRAPRVQTSETPLRGQVLGMLAAY